MLLPKNNAASNKSQIPTCEITEYNSNFHFQIGDAMELGGG